MGMTADERRRLAELAQQLEGELPGVSRALTEGLGRRASTWRWVMRHVFGASRGGPTLTRERIWIDGTLGLVGSSLALLGLVRQQPLVFGPGAVLALIVPSVYLARVLFRWAVWVVHYYQQPLDKDRRTPWP